MSSSNSTSDLSDEKLKDQRRSTPASRLRCPNCDHELDCNPDMVGFPAGVKFDPSDQELVEHLESMVNEGGSRAHPFISNFIPTLQEDDGICYTHPENLPGMTRDGVSKYFFHRPSKAFTSGTRKRRKIQSKHGDDVGEARWHKTGKTRPVMVGGRQKGCKKILVLYSNYGKQGNKPEKTNWVMHQYHLGKDEEKDGELVVSKVFYQQMRLRSTSTKSDDEKVEVASEAMKDMLRECGAEGAEAADTMLQMQQHQQKMQADGHNMFTSAKMSHEVGVGHPLAEDQGRQLHVTHHIPSQHKGRSVLMNPVRTMSLVKNTTLNTESTKLSPAMQYPSALLNNGEKQEDQQQQQKKVHCRRPCSSQEAMIACQQTTSTEDVQEASTQHKEKQQSYEHWPPDHHQDG